MDRYQAFLEESVAHKPELADDLSRLGDLYSRKLWHELTCALEEIVAKPVVRQDGFLLALYQKFIAGFAQRINLLKLAQFAVAAAQEIANPAEGMAFIKDVIDSLEGSRVVDPEAALLYLRCRVVGYQVASGDLSGARRGLEELEVALEALPEADRLVPAEVHRADMAYRKARGQHGEFYRAALQYLAFADLEKMPLEQRAALAADVGLAALLADDVHDFGALLLHPVAEALRADASRAWLLELLEAFHKGDIAAYERTCAAHAAELNAQPELVANERKLREKVTVACLLVQLHERPPAQRRVPLADVAARTHLSAEGAEALVLKALGLGLVEGTIDGVDETLDVIWVAPRILDNNGIAQLRDRISDWLARVDRAAADFERDAAGVIAAA